MNEDIKKELEQISPILAKIQGKTKQSAAPDGYLEAFEDNFFEKIKTENLNQAQKPSAKTILFRPWMRWAVAASVLLVAGFWWVNQTSPTSTLNASSLAEQLSDAELEDYIIENIEDFDIQTLASMEAEDSESDETIWLDSSDDVLDDISLEELEQLL